MGGILPCRATEWQLKGCAPKASLWAREGKVTPRLGAGCVLSRYTFAGAGVSYCASHSRWTLGEISLGLISLRPPQKTFV